MYSLRAVSIALGTGHRTANALVATAIGSGRQGRARLYDMGQVELFATALLLRRDLRVPLRKAVSLARDVLAAPGGVLQTSRLVTVSFDRAGLAEILRRALADAVEMELPTRRGRPRRKRERGAL